MGRTSGHFCGFGSRSGDISACCAAPPHIQAAISQSAQNLRRNLDLPLWVAGFACIFIVQSVCIQRKHNRKTAAITYVAPLDAACTQTPPRSRGQAVLRARVWAGASVLADLKQQGALKVLFPRGADFQAVLLNTSGGVTGGDQFQIDATADAGSRMTITTQAAERAYRAASGTARIDNHLTVQDGATLQWLPQETILFQGCSLTRRLRVDLAPDARLLMAEPLAFGRLASGERLTSAALSDEICIYRAGVPLYFDRTRLSGDVAQALAGAATGRGAAAMASVVYVSPDADAQLDWIRAALPPLGGASLLTPDCLVLRVLADDSFALRQTLLPILDRLSQNTLPKCWRL